MKKCVIALFALVVAASACAAAQEEEFSEVEYYRQLAKQQLEDARKAEEADAEPAVEVVIEPEVVVVEVIEDAEDDPEVEFADESEPEPMVVIAAEPEPVHYQYYETPPCAVCEKDAPANALVFIPQYFHSRNDGATFKVGSKRLKMSKGRANGAGGTLLYTRRVNDWFSFGLSYQYAFMRVTGGMAVDRAAVDPAKERSHWHSHVVGFLPEFNLGDFGRLQLSVVQGFDRASGGETVYAAPPVRRDVDDYGTNVTSLMAWYEKPFELGCSNWTVSPYAGWRSLYVSVKDANNWAGNPGDKYDDNMWVHLIAGGVKASYQKDGFAMNFRAGVSHRTSRDDVPGYGNRAVAPGVVHFSHRANLDKTVGSVGADVNYAISERAMVGVGYDGFFGKDTSAHMGTLKFILSF